MERLDITSADGTKIAGYRWSPEGEPRGELVLAHGFGEHIGRYEHVVQELLGRGWRITAGDFRGHGHSQGKRGHVDGWFQYVDDLRAVVSHVHGPYTLLAHSMGGLVAMDFLRDAHDCEAAILSAPLIEAAVAAPRWKTSAARILSKVLPRLSMDSELPAENICSDPAVVERYVNDPLVFGTLTPRWYTSMLKAQERSRTHAPYYSVPMYLFWGTGERVIATSALEQLARDWGGPSAHRAWPDLFHETLNERNGLDVLGEALAWRDALDVTGSAA